MRKILFSLLMVILIGGVTSFGVASEKVQKNSTTIHQSNTLKCQNIPNCTIQAPDGVCKKSIDKSIPYLARKGCCSWHKGVCGCDKKTNKIICCDGTFSPSCTCSGY